MGGDVFFVDQGLHIALDNGIVRVTISKPGGIITGIRYGGLDNLLEVLNKETNRGLFIFNLFIFPHLFIYIPTNIRTST
jgi:rhamnogalacturonan endolyase